MKHRRILVTSALPYANAPLHLGHILEAVQTDVWVRFQRRRGHECHYVCADDAHGTAIMLRAEQRGIAAEQHIAEIRESHEADFRAFLIDVDNYYSTHSPENRELAESIYIALRNRGHIVSRTVTQAYDTEKEMFLADRFIKGTCPRCHTADQYGDNCEACGATYAANELIDPVSVLSGKPPVERESEHFFFDLPQFEGFLREWLNSEALQPEVARKLSEWLDAGLQAWDISRDAPYFGFEIPDAPGKYFYVWLDAPIGYMASFRNLCERSDLNFDDFWARDSEAELYHFIGKDIINFHGLFWPAMLESAGYRLPSGVFAHGFVTVNGTKMSKSRGTFINAGTYLQHLPAEPLRYYYAAKLGAGVDDIDLNLEDFVQRVNSDLVGKVVNIASRCSGFIHRLNGGRLGSSLERPGLWQQALASGDSIAAAYEKREYSRAIREIMALADAANEYIAERAPWKLAKNEPDQPAAVATCTQALNLFRLLALYLSPVLPELAERSARFLNSSLDWSSAPEPLLDHAIEPYEPLMQRIDTAAINAIVSAGQNPSPGATTEPNTATQEQTSDMITFDEFSRIDLRVARVLAAEPVEGADRLLRLTLDLGDHQRTVLSGIRQQVAAEQLIGRNLVVVANLEPRKMRFGVSEGMVLCAGDDDALFVLGVDDAAKPGSRIS